MEDRRAGLVLKGAGDGSCVTMSLPSLAHWGPSPRLSVTLLPPVPALVAVLPVLRRLPDFPVTPTEEPHLEREREGERKGERGGRGRGNKGERKGESVSK